MRRAGIAVAAFAMIAPVAGCGSPGRTAAERISDAPAALRDMGLALPASARIDYAERSSGLDDAAWIAATMTKADWASFRARWIETGQPRAAIFSAEDNIMLTADRDGWRPGAAKGLATAGLSWRDGREAMNVGVAPAGPGEVRIFLFWHQM